jgi:phosphatidylinositol 4-kinase
MQIMRLFSNSFLEAKVDLILKPYDIVVTSKDSGFLEFVADSFSIDQLKKDLGSDLNVIFRNLFKNNLRKAQMNFMRSLAAYSLFCYFLQIKGIQLYFDL